MKKHLKLVSVMFFMLVSHVHANAIEKPNISIETNTSDIKVGEDFYITIISSQINDCFSLSFDFKYNSDIIKLISAHPGSSFEDEPIEYNGMVKQISNNCNIFSYYSTFKGDSSGKTLENNSEIIKIKARLLKECKIPFNIIDNHSELFIGTPNIKVIIIDKNLEKVNLSNTSKYINSSNFNSDEDIKYFIKDVYIKAFSRDFDAFGFTYWYNKLISQEYSTRMFLINLLNEKEFIENNLSNEEFITAMYSIIANRYPDQNGYDYWLQKLINLSKNTDIKEVKSQIILMICNEAELKERALNMNLAY